jgi:hypothetical protein
MNTLEHPKKLFSELRIVGWVWKDKNYLSTWEGKTERWEVRNVDPMQIKYMFSSEHRKPFDDIAEVVPFTGRDYTDKLVVIAFTDNQDDTH